MLGSPKSLTVVLLLDMGAGDQCLREVRLPVDLSEYPDVRLAESLIVHLEMEGCAGSYPAKRTEIYHGTPGRIQEFAPSNAGNSASPQTTCPS
jgi:hypothetical protein